MPEIHPSWFPAVSGKTPDPGTRNDSFNWYTDKEGANIFHYHLRGVTVPHEDVINSAKRTPDGKSIKLFGYIIHSFGTAMGRRWDAVNGWTS